MAAVGGHLARPSEEPAVQHPCRYRPEIGARLHEDGLLIAKAAVAGATDATPTVRALLLERLAWAAVRCHDPDTCRRALDAVNDACDRR
jgi:hypothetical protein